MNVKLNSWNKRVKVNAHTFLLFLVRLSKFGTSALFRDWAGGFGKYFDWTTDSSCDWALLPNDHGRSVVLIFIE